MKIEEVLEKQLLAEGPSIERFDEDFYGDFYDYFVNFLKFKCLSQGKDLASLEKQKLVLYLDLFNSQDFPGRKAYRYKLVFDSQLNFLAAESDFTLSALCRDLRGRVDQLSDYEAVRSQALASLVERFDSKNPDPNTRIQNFNVVLADLYDRYNLSRFKTAYQLVG